MDASDPKPKPQENQGSLQLSLDLTSAFDVLCWELISKSMAEAQIPEQLTSWVSSWYCEVRYCVSHLGWEKCAQASVKGAYYSALALESLHWLSACIPAAGCSARVCCTECNVLRGRRPRL